MIPPLLFCGLEMCGLEMHTRFKKQFTKIINYIKTVYLPACEEIRAKDPGTLSAPIGRISGWIDKVEKAGGVPEMAAGFQPQKEKEVELNEAT